MTEGERIPLDLDPEFSTKRESIQRSMYDDDGYRMNRIIGNRPSSLISCGTVFKKLIKNQFPNNNKQKVKQSNKQYPSGSTDTPNNQERHTAATT